MSTISKQKAEFIATKSLESVTKKIDELKNQIKEEGRLLILGTIPDDVIVCFEKHPEYFKTRQNVTLNGNFSINLASQIPLKDYYLNLPAEKSKNIEKLRNQKEKLDKKFESDKLVLIQCLLGLKSSVKIIKEFPQFYTYFENDNITTLCVPISEAHNILNEL